MPEMWVAAGSRGGGNTVAGQLKLCTRSKYWLHLGAGGGSREAEVMYKIKILLTVELKGRMVREEGGSGKNLGGEPVTEEECSRIR